MKFNDWWRKHIEADRAVLLKAKEWSGKAGRALRKAMEDAEDSCSGCTALATAKDYIGELEDRDEKAQAELARLNVESSELKDCIKALQKDLNEELTKIEALEKAGDRLRCWIWGNKELLPTPLCRQVAPSCVQAWDNLRKDNKELGD